MKILETMSFNSQSTPVNKFSPVTALQLIIHQWWLLISSRPSAYRRMNTPAYVFIATLTNLIKLIWINKSYTTAFAVGVNLTSRIASFDSAPGKSCLFANTSSVAPANLWMEEITVMTTMFDICSFMWFLTSVCIPLPAAEHWAPAYNPAVWVCLRCPPPTQDHLCSQSSSSSRTAVTSDPLHPKYSAYTWKNTHFFFVNTHLT